MRVLVTGGTGYVGRAVIPRLLLRGIDVLALARPARKGQVAEGRGIEWIYGELDDGPFVRAAAARTDATLHLAAQHDAYMEGIDAAAVRAISDGLKGSGKVFITTSASPVYGDTGLQPRDESEPVIEPYPMRLFRLQHDRFVAGLTSVDIRGVVIRPPFVYGRAGGVLVTFIRQAIDDRVARVIGEGINSWSTVHVDDLADLYVRALLNEAGVGTFNAGSIETVSMRDVADAIARSFGPGIAVRSWTEAEAVEHLGTLMPMMALEQHILSDRAYRELGWAPRPSGLIVDLLYGSYKQMPLVSYSH